MNATRMSTATNSQPPAISSAELKRMTKDQLIDMLMVSLAGQQSTGIELNKIRQNVAAIEKDLLAARTERDRAFIELKASQNEADRAIRDLRQVTTDRDQCRTERDKLLGYLDRVLEDDRIRDGKSGEVETQNYAPSIERIRRGPNLKGDNIPF